MQSSACWGTMGKVENSERSKALKIGIVGGGAAGLFAAIGAAENGAEVLLFEKNPFFGKKIRITGKGRCNLTNDCAVPEAEEKIVRGAKFLRTALYHLPPRGVMDLFTRWGVPLKTERGGRVFPVSDKAADIAEALIRKARSFPKTRAVFEEVREIEKKDSFWIRTEKREYAVERVILCCGGMSYPLCGSTGDGYRFAERFGHTVTPPLPSLIPLKTKEDVSSLAGLSPKNVTFTVKTRAGKKVFSQMGEMLFTHFGVSGPLVLSASAYLDWEKEKEYLGLIDWKPALTPEEVRARLQRDLAEFKNKDLIHALEALLPKKAIAPFLEKAGADPRKKASEITKEERERLAANLKADPLTLTGTRPIAEAIVTRGGVKLSEVDPRTMESKRQKGLYLAGEMLDADALTGGFNLQIAFSTGYLAGKRSAGEA